MKLTVIQQQLIEKIGVSLECKGQRPATARIIGLLFVADVPAITFEEILETQQLSKSATSNAINHLLHSEQLEYFTLTGDRRRYFRLKLSNWQERILRQVQDITSFSQVLRQVLEVRTTDTPNYNRQIRELNSFMEYISARMPQLLEEWKKEEFNLSN